MGKYPGKSVRCQTECKMFFNSHKTTLYEEKSAVNTRINFLVPTLSHRCRIRSKYGARNSRSLDYGTIAAVTLKGSRTKCDLNKRLACTLCAPTPHRDSPCIERLNKQDKLQSSSYAQWGHLQQWVKCCSITVSHREPGTGTTPLVENYLELVLYYTHIPFFRCQQIVS